MRILLTLVAVTLGAAAPPPIDWNRHFAGITGTFVLLDGRSGAFTRYNVRRAAERFAPCSTFKIPNTAILLESGAAPDPDYKVAYDPALHIDNPDWARDHTLRSAFKVSALWYYQAVSQRAGLATEAKLVRQLHYGNESTAGGIDVMLRPFWVDGTLRISADEQVRFLQRFHDGGVGLSARATTLTKEIMVADQGAGWVLSAKTGACHPAGEDTILWYVGWVEKAREVSYFAFNMGDKDYTRVNERIPRTRAILADLGVLPAQ